LAFESCTKLFRIIDIQLGLFFRSNKLHQNKSYLLVFLRLTVTSRIEHIVDHGNSLHIAPVVADRKSRRSLRVVYQVRMVFRQPTPNSIVAAQRNAEVVPNEQPEKLRQTHLITKFLQYFSMLSSLESFNRF